MAKAYGETEPPVIEALHAVLRSQTEPTKLPELRAKLAGAIRSLAEATDDINRRMMIRLMGVLKRYVDGLFSPAPISPRARQRAGPNFLVRMGRTCGPCGPCGPCTAE
jgi:hypothetical protein